ncbi:MAG: alpha/beta fold hydrolase [Alphaproteobacteria bacterium]
MAPRPPLVLAPGHMADGGLWAHQTAHLDEVAAVTVADLTRHDDVGAMAEAVLREAPPRFALAGFSMGGYLAFEIVRRAPERVLRLALIDTSARADTDEQRARRQRFMAMGERGELDQVMALYMPLFVHPGLLPESPVVDGLTAMARRVGAAAFLNQQKVMLGRPDSRAGLAAIGVPTLVMCGRQDALTPLDAHREMAASIPGARLVVVEDSGHMSPLEQPQAVTAVLRYWLQG